MYNIIQLNDKELSELQSIAKELGIKNAESMKKDELVYGILDEQAIVNASKRNTNKDNESQPRKRSRVSVKKEGDKVYTATERGVKPLLTWLDSGADFKNASAADRVVGRATAFLYCLLGMTEVYARVMSTPAAEVLRANGIDVHIGLEVEGIINRRRTGPCPFEAAVMEISDPIQALAAIRKKLEQM